MTKSISVILANNVIHIPLIKKEKKNKDNWIRLNNQLNKIIDNVTNKNFLNVIIVQTVQRAASDTWL